MGHVHLGTLPDTRPWRRVVGHLADGTGAAVVAGATSAAAVRGLDLAEHDPGVARVVFLLARTVLAGREADFAAALAVHSLDIPANPSLFDLTAGFTEALRRWHDSASRARSDVAVMAELAAVEALTRCVGDRGVSLFPTGDEVHRAARELSTQTGFATLAYEFYARFAQRFLLYHLERELPQHVGANGRFANRAAHTAFVEDLEIHCREAAIIVRQYAGDWYSKARFEDGVSERRAQRFAAHCLVKLRRELEVRGAADG